MRERTQDIGIAGFADDPYLVLLAVGKAVLPHRTGHMLAAALDVLGGQILPTRNNDLPVRAGVDAARAGRSASGQYQRAQQQVPHTVRPLQNSRYSASISA